MVLSFNIKVNDELLKAFPRGDIRIPTPLTLVMRATHFFIRRLPYYWSFDRFENVRRLFSRQ